MPQSEHWPFNKAVESSDASSEPSLLQKQVGVMEDEVKEMQTELAAMKRERLHMNNRKHASGIDSAKDKDIAMYEGSWKSHGEIDFISEPQRSKLREDLIRAKNAADEERFQREKVERKLKDLELKLNSICTQETVDVRNESRKFSNEELTALKKQLRDMKEETEELKMTLSEKIEESQEYRLKYLQAQQQVEEMKRQIDLIEFDNKQVSDQIQIEIQKMKMQFQEKLQELAPLPDLLKGAQIQLQEAKQLQKLAEDSSEQLSNELHRVKEKLVIAVNNFNLEKADRIKMIENNKALRIEIEQKQREIDELSKTIDDYKCTILRLEEKLSQLETRYKEKATECSQLLKDLDELRTESSRSLTRSKERSDSMRRYMQTQVSELERQLIQSRAQCRTCQKERDDIRQRMQMQINNLQENFEVVEIRLRALQNQVTGLKNTYAIFLADEDDNYDVTKIIP
ncbi:outer dense fiber protein 2-like [Melitaea cinxia]|uniref:outer dense fiber protein 2-like n=1 Tax=Melitaea cinxia TaxID=113334 RepID=UPI001E270D4F|nr:outer dense fiber protein 2-like [Melitaea cinxia]